MLRVDEPVPTPAGWTTMGALKRGDTVFDSDGNQCQVVRAYIPVMPLSSYRLTFDDGSVVDSCSDHKWLTFDAKELGALTKRTSQYRERRREMRPARIGGHKSERFSVAIAERNRTTCRPATLPPPTGTVRTTAEIASTIATKIGRANHAVPVTGALQIHDASLPIDPYILGVWLGDGTSSGGAVTTADAEIVEALFEFSPSKRSGKYAWGTHGLSPLLRRLGVLNNKHVPAEYLRGSVSQRLALLQGLMDTDGCSCESGAVEFTSTKRVLAEAVVEMALSLGSKARLCDGVATLYGKVIGPKYRVKWTPDYPAFRLSRKLASQKMARRRTTKFRYIVRADRTNPTLMRCIEVDSPTHLYLASRSMIPTHNSDALLMAALQYVDEPGYAAILFRRTYADLSLPGALMDRAAEWLSGTDARWSDKTKTWVFPSGATITFGYMETERDKYRYQSSEFQLVGFDELTQFPDSQYRYMFSRLRRLKDSHVPLRMRAASNPGGIGHEWVKQRFITEGMKSGRPFIPARMEDNPHLELESYERGLNQLDPVTRAQLKSGDWSARQSGDKFKREWFEIVDAAPADLRLVRRWDRAATEAKPGKEPDWTCGCLMGLSAATQTIYITDVKRLRGTPGANERLIKQTAELDGRRVAIRMEQEPGSSGVDTIDHYTRKVLMGWDFKGKRSTGSKEERANPLSAQAEAGNVKLVRGAWIGEFLDELEAFPNGSHDDQVDAASSALSDLVAPKADPMGIG